MLVVLFGAWLIFVSVVSAVAPKAALWFLGKMASTQLINVTELTLRLIAGLALFFAAPQSLFPELFRIVGGFMAATSVILLMVPRRWHARYAQWWSKTLSPLAVRLLAPVSFAAGTFLIYAVA